MLTNTPAFNELVPNDGSGPSIGIGGNNSDQSLTQHVMVGGTPTVQPATAWHAPGFYWNTGAPILLQGPYQGYGPLQTKAPATPRTNGSYREIIYQIFKNGDVIGAGDLIVKAPPIPTAGSICVPGVQ